MADVLLIYCMLFDYTGVPPLLSRRILETLTYLARNHPYVAKILLQFRHPPSALREPDNANNVHGKAVMVIGDEVNSENNGYITIAMLLSLLNQPLYLRSIAHLEQVMIWFLCGMFSILFLCMQTMRT